MLAAFAIAVGLASPPAADVAQPRQYEGATSVPSSVPPSPDPPEATTDAVAEGSDAPEIPLAGPASDTPSDEEQRAAEQDARGWAVAPDATAGHKALWVPRVVLYPVRLVFTAIAWPIDKVLKSGKGVAPTYVKKAFVWNDAGTVGWLPHASFLSGFGLTYGARVFHRDLLGNGEKLQAKALFGGVVAQKYQVRFEADRAAGYPVWLDIRTRFESNPSLLFRGYGQPDRVSADATDVSPRDGEAFTRYGQRRFLHVLRGGYVAGRPTREFRPGVEFVYNNRQFGSKGRGTGRSIEEVYDTSAIPGFEETTDIARINAAFDIDFRNHRGRPSRGFLFSGIAGGAPPQDGFGFGQYAAEVVGFINIYKDTRILVLRAAIEGLHGPDDKIPFSELALLGGAYRLRGYHLGRFRDKRSALATVEYRYPIHQFLSGHVFVDGGRVGRNYEDLFAAPVGDYHFGFGGGFTVRTLDRLIGKLDLAYGDGLQLTLSLDPLQAFATRSKQL